jgi:molecular chaperone DnaK
MPNQRSASETETGCERGHMSKRDDTSLVSACNRALSRVGSDNALVSRGLAELLDLTPLTLWIKMLDGVLTPLIPRSTSIPIRKSVTITTATDDQPSIVIEVYQQERPIADDNNKIGRLHVDGIPPSLAGAPKIEVTFDIDANGILNVTAKDLGTGKQLNVRLKCLRGLSLNEIEEELKRAGSAGTS